MKAGLDFAGEAAQRAFDCMCAIGGLLLLAPLLAAIAAWIAVSDGMPVLYRQVRVGRGGGHFRIIKFRTMRVGSVGRQITAGGDERVTPIGAVLRRHKLDELPQLVNVLRGEMSLVGPRPEVPEYVEPASPIWQAVLHTRPGITDLASLVYRNEEELLGSRVDPELYYRTHVQPEKLSLNLVYLNNRNLWLDFKLILASIRYSLFPEQFNPDAICRTFAAGRSI